MREFFDFGSWREMAGQSVTELGRSFVAFLPNLLAAILLLVAGWLVSKLVELISAKLLKRFGLDRAVARVGLSPILQQAGIVDPASRLVARVVFWVLMLTFVISAVETIGLTGIVPTIDRVVGWLPQLAAAALVLVVGLLLARFARNLVSSAAAAAGVADAPRLGGIAHTLVVLSVAVIALEQLGIETQLLVLVLTAVVATLGLTFGAALAMGSHGLVAHILAGHFLRQNLPNGTSVEVRGKRGVVERVGSVDTLFRDADSTWTVPNAQLIEESIVR